MIQALATAAAGGRAFLLRLDTIAHNIANAQTPGFKRGRVSFADLLHQKLGSANSGVRIASMDRIFEPGALQRTGRDLDLAIEGEGFLAVLLADGSPAYTRAGTLALDAAGNLVTSQGLPLEPPIALSEDLSRVLIDPLGRVWGFDPGDPEALVEAGRIRLARFANPSGLDLVGENLFRQTDASGPAQLGRPGESDAFGWVRQGYLEASNVDPVRERTDLLATIRAFELNGRVIEAADQALQAVNNLRRDRP